MTNVHSLFVSSISVESWSHRHPHLVFEPHTATRMESEGPLGHIRTSSPVVVPSFLQGRYSHDLQSPWLSFWELSSVSVSQAIDADRSAPVPLPVPPIFRFKRWLPFLDHLAPRRSSFTISPLLGWPSATATLSRLHGIHGLL